MAVLTRHQVERLAEIVRQHAAWFIWRTLGSQAVTQGDVDRLKASGLLPMDVNVDSIKYAWVLGKLESILKENKWKNLPWDELVAEAEGRRLSPVEKLQLEAASLTAFTKFRGLAEDINSDLYERLAQATGKVVSEAQVRGTIKDIVQTGVEMNETYLGVAKQLVDSLMEPGRNWTRVAATELHAAQQRGYAAALYNREGIYEDAEGPDSEVFIRLDPHACEDCKRLYMDPSTGHPKVFVLKDLVANEGTNYQRPWRVNARPCVPPLHPHCYCRLSYKPPGWGWDKDGEFTLIDPKEAYPGVIS